MTRDEEREFHRTGRRPLAEEGPQRRDDREADSPSQMGSPMAMRRQTARECLEGRVAQLRTQADQLEQLLKALPQEFSYTADTALLDIVLGSRQV